jgi:hypothetical protein
MVPGRLVKSARKSVAVFSGHWDWRDAAVVELFAPHAVPHRWVSRVVLVVDRRLYPR